MKRPRQQAEGRVLGPRDYMRLLTLPPGLRVCRCHREPAPCESCQAQEEWRQWNREHGEVVGDLYDRGQAVPHDMLPSYFWAEP